MPHVPFQLRYTLNRSQRLVPHARLWGVFATLFIPALFLFFCAHAVIAAWSFDFLSIAVSGVFALGILLLFRGLFVGIVDVLIVARREVDVVIEENAAGILLGKQRWYLYLDGITSLTQYRADVWTIEHYNGSVLHVPASAITHEQLSHIRSAMERGRTPEGVQAVVERGRRLAKLRRTAPAERSGRGSF